MAMLGGFVRVSFRVKFRLVSRRSESVQRRPERIGQSCLSHRRGSFSTSYGAEALQVFPAGGGETGWFKQQYTLTRRDHARVAQDHLAPSRLPDGGMASALLPRAER